MQWEGFLIKILGEKAIVKPKANWVMFYYMDGYTATVPIEDAPREDSIVAFKPRTGLPSQNFHTSFVRMEER